MQSLLPSHKTVARWGTGFSLLSLIFMLPGNATDGPNPPSPLAPASNISGDVATLFWITISIGIAVFFIVVALMLFAIIRYRRRDDDEMPEQIHGNTTLELIWTIIPSVIMLALFGLTLNTLFSQEQLPDDALIIEVVGRQWFWDFNYPETEVSLRNELVLPVGRPIIFEITSADVIHSFWIPQLSGKMDAVPGHTNILWFEIEEEGEYAGQCAEFCGLQHYAMLFDVTALPEDEYAEWEAETVFAQSQFDPIYADPEQPLDVTELILPIGDEGRGEQLFTDYGCEACHSLDGTTLVGPSQLGYSIRADDRIDEYTAEQYTIESILRPCDFLAPGYTCVMPQNFGEQMEDQDLADLVTFLLAQ